MAYGELNARANRLAYYLMGLGVGPEKMVGICLERSVDMVVALLGTLKAGGAYLPLDPDYPAARLGRWWRMPPHRGADDDRHQSVSAGDGRTCRSIQESCTAWPRPGPTTPPMRTRMPAPLAAPCLCHLHVGLHRRTQRSRRSAPRTHKLPLLG